MGYVLLDSYKNSPGTEINSAQEGVCLYGSYIDSVSVFNRSDATTLRFFVEAFKLKIYVTPATEPGSPSVTNGST